MGLSPTWHHTFLSVPDVLDLIHNLFQKYPWLEDSDERKNMTDKGILDKYIDLDKSCFTESEKREARDMIYKYKDAFSLRDEIGTCPSIEIDIDITDKTLFFIGPYHTKEEDKKILLV